MKDASESQDDEEKKKSVSDSSSPKSKKNMRPNVPPTENKNRFDSNSNETSEKDQNSTVYNKREQKLIHKRGEEEPSLRIPPHQNSMPQYYESEMGNRSRFTRERSFCMQEPYQEEMNAALNFTPAMLRDDYPMHENNQRYGPKAFGATMRIMPFEMCITDQALSMIKSSSVTHFWNLPGVIRTSK